MRGFQGSDGVGNTRCCARSPLPGTTKPARGGKSGGRTRRAAICAVQAVPRQRTVARAVKPGHLVQRPHLPPQQRGDKPFPQPAHSQPSRKTTARPPQTPAPANRNGAAGPATCATAERAAPMPAHVDASYQRFFFMVQLLSRSSGCWRRGAPSPCRSSGRFRCRTGTADGCRTAACPASTGRRLGRQPRWPGRYAHLR